MKKDCKQVWENCLNFIKDNISDKKLFDTWFNPLEPLKLEDDILTLKVPSMFFYEFIEENYIDVLKAAIRKELGHNAQLLYSVVMDTAIKNTTANPLLPSNNLPATQNFAQNIPVSIDSQVKDLPNPFVIPGLRKVKVNSQLNENYSFENFKDLYPIPDFNIIAKILNDRGWEIKQFEYIEDTQVYRKTKQMQSLKVVCNKEIKKKFIEEKYNYQMNDKGELELI